MHASARWHTAGRPIVNLAENPSSALLEVLVHLETDDEDQPDTYQLLKIESEDSLDFESVPLSSLSPAWRSDEIETQAIGNAWLLRCKSALLRVPSAITPETWNWILNPRHADAARLRIASAEQHVHDVRLFKS